MAQKRARSLSPPNSGDAASQTEEPFFKSNTIEDRQSTFVAIYSPKVSGRDLQKHPDFKRADHKMLATREASTQRTLGNTGRRIYNTWSDDDGEKYAGKHLEKVLTELDVEGAVVVARWYGGVLLGPVRFEHIRTVARDAIRNWQSAKKATGEGQVKKLKVEEEAVVKARLAKQLAERDQNITVLRKLLAEKTRPTGETVKQDTAERDQSSSAKQLKYDEMPLARLRQLEKARDATLAFVLKQIDAAEEKDPENRPI